MNRKIKAVILGLFALLCVSVAELELRQQQLQHQLDLFGEFYTLLDKNYVDTLNLPDLMKRSMRKTLGELDPYSNYFDIEETKDRGKAWQGIQYAGIGSTVKQTDSGVVIVEPAEGLPSVKAGLRAGDLVVEINGQNVQHMLLDSVIRRLKGTEGDSIHLTLKRPYKGIIHKAFVRENIIYKPVPLYYLQADSTGYILFSHFLSGSSKALKNAVADLKSKGMKKLILDMRGNSGGLVEECSSALSIFFPVNTLVCSLRLKDSTANYSYKTNDTPLDTTLPLIILTDRHTISSGEIFAGCMKDHKRATLVGDRTYGKGFVQGTRFFKGGQSLYVTVARYYTPSGSFIGAKGVDPDVQFLAADTVPPHLLAVINSGIITEYSIRYRNTKPDGAIFNNDVEFENFKKFYLSKLDSIKFPEESTLQELSLYPSSKNLKTEIMNRKRQLPAVYKKEFETELKREILKRYYQFARSGQLGFEETAMFRFLTNRHL